MRREDRDYASLWDALQAARRVTEYVEGKSIGTYLKNSMVRAAVEREFILIGEALNRLTETSANSLPELPIESLIGLRNIVTHQYEFVDHARIFAIATEQMATLIRALENALPPEPPDPEPEGDS